MLYITLGVSLAVIDLGGAIVSIYTKEPDISLSIKLWIDKSTGEVEVLTSPTPDMQPLEIAELLMDMSTRLFEQAGEVKRIPRLSLVKN